MLILAIGIQISMNSVCMILLWVVSIERCKLFSIYIRNSFFFSFLKLHFTSVIRRLIMTS